MYPNCSLLNVPLYDVIVRSIPSSWNENGKNPAIITCLINESSDSLSTPHLILIFFFSVTISPIMSPDAARPVLDDQIISSSTVICTGAGSVMLPDHNTFAATSHPLYVTSSHLPFDLVFWFVFLIKYFLKDSSSSATGSIPFSSSNICFRSAKTSEEEMPPAACAALFAIS